MPKVCVFCGSPPKSKNKEHVLPQWLIGLTGDPGRKVYLGREWTNPQLKQRVYSLSAFVFPACQDCNEEYSALESQAKSLMYSLLKGLPASEGDFDVLLDWFDKVRTGLWVSFLYLNKNYRELSPQFYIKSRIAAKDRLLFIYRDLNELDGLVITGVESPIFQVMPSCFALSVNHLHFFSASAQDLLAPRFGFPYLTNRKLARDREGMGAEVVEGSGHTVLPLISFPLAPGGTQLYQPMIPADVRAADKMGPWNEPYVIQNCRDHSKGRGRIFIEREGSLSKYPDGLSSAWIPPSQFTKLECISKITLMTGEWLEKLYSNVPDTSELTPEQVEFIKKSTGGILRLHRLMMEHVKQQLENATSVERFVPD